MRFFHGRSIFDRSKSFFSKGGERTVAVKRNILGSFIYKGLSLLISLILVPLTLGYVSSELYGIWLTLSSIVGWMGILDIGFSQGLKNKLAESIALNNWTRGKELVSTTYFVMILIFVPVGIIMEAVIPFVDWSSFLKISAVYNSEVCYAMQILVAIFCLHMIVGVLSAIVSAFQKVSLTGLFNVIGHFLSLIAIFVMTKSLSPSLPGLALAYSGLPILVLFVASIILFVGKFKRVAPSLDYIRKGHIKDIFNLGYKFFIIHLQMLVMFQTTNILISRISGPEAVSSYNISYKYISIAMLLFNIVVSPLWPAYTDAFTKKDFSWMNSIYNKMCRLATVVILTIVIMLAISPVVYNVWIGQKVDIPFSMTLVVAIYTILMCWNSLQTQIINGTGKVNLQLYLTLVGLFSQIPFALFLGNIVGPEGVIISQIIIITVYAFIFTIQAKKILKNEASGVWGK